MDTAVCLLWTDHEVLLHILGLQTEREQIAEEALGHRPW